MSLLAAVPLSAKPSKAISLQHLGTHSSGVYDGAAAEIVAHDPTTQRLFVVNAQAARVDVLNIENPAAPAKVATIEVAPLGGVANSVAVHNGLIAVAVEDQVKTNPGRVVFYDRDLNYLAQVEVGAQPDMLTFTPNGRYVLVANEGEPNDDYTIDPEGSISIIELSGNLDKLDQTKVRTATFTPFNGQTLDPAIRVFGPNASVAQDLEPEYIVVSRDSKTAWVTLQENNALATIDIATAKVTRLVPFGFKDHSKVESTATIYEFDPATMPSIGSTLAGQPISLGGFSGLYFEGIDPVTKRYRFVTHTDRGPNAEPNGVFRPFLLPDFAPEVVRFELDRGTGQLTITQRIPLQRSPGVPLTGLPNTSINASGSAPYNDEVPVDLLGRILPLDSMGADLEGIVVDRESGAFWMVDEYRPAIYRFSAAGVMEARYVPIGTAAAAGAAPGTFGTEVLPAELAQRRQNRGFEALAWSNGKLYAFVQSPLRNPATLSNGALNSMRNIRIVELDPLSLATRQFLYVMDNADLGGAPNSRADKIGDAVAVGNGEFLVVERDDDSFPDDELSVIEKKIYRFNLNGATDLSGVGYPVGATGKSVDQLTMAELLANNIVPVYKQLEVDLTQAGYNRVEKVEGLALIDESTLAVINDNDFGVAAITVQPDGRFELDYEPETIQLGIIELRSHGLDASDSDGQINIRPWPVKGMYMPDSIAAFHAGATTYLLTANEGDVRDWQGFAENVRVGSSHVVLDPVAFPQGRVLKHSSNLGRLTISNVMGRASPGGPYRELYAFGGRSFSVWTTEGQLVWDSGDDFERITAAAYPTRFNASNSNHTFDNRSDDKGPEPEGIVVGKAYGRDFAFIGLERIGGVMVYDLSNPRSPEFVTYVNRRDFGASVRDPFVSDLGPEGLLFIKADDSPTGRPLLVVGAETSGTTSIFEVLPAK
jgi:hypothetical protein